MSIRNMRFKAGLMLALVSLSSIGFSLTAQQPRNKRKMPVTQQYQASSFDSKPAVDVAKINAENRARQEQQEDAIAELKELIKLKAELYQIDDPIQNNEDIQTAASYPVQVTNGNNLIQTNYQETADIKDLEARYSEDILKATREIDYLKKQLEIANNQLSECKATGSTMRAPTAIESQPALNNPNLSKQQKRPKKTKGNKNQQIQVYNAQQQSSQQALANEKRIKKEQQQREQLQKQEAQRKIIEELEQQLMDLNSTAN